MFAAIVRCKHAYPNLARMQASCWSVENYSPEPDFSIEKLVQAGREYDLRASVEGSAAADGAAPSSCRCATFPPPLEMCSPLQMHTPSEWLLAAQCLKPT